MLQELHIGTREYSWIVGPFQGAITTQPICGYVLYFAWRTVQSDWQRTGELEGLVHMAVVTNQIAEANDGIGGSQIVFDRKQPRKVGMNVTDDCYAHIQQRGRELNRLKKTVADTRSSGALLRSRHPNSNLLQDHFDR